MQMKQKIEKPDNAKGCVSVTVRARMCPRWGQFWCGEGARGGWGGGGGSRPHAISNHKGRQNIQRSVFTHLFG